MKSDEINSCKFCSIKHEEQIEVASGNRIGVYMKHENDKYYIQGCADDYTDFCEISYCPFCGRDLR